MNALSMEYIIDMKRIDNFFETAISNYINNLNYAYLVTETTHNDDEFKMLYIEAEGQLIGKLKKTFEAIIQAIKSCIEKIRNAANTEAQKMKLKQIAKKIKSNSIKYIRKEYSNGRVTKDGKRGAIQSTQADYKKYIVLINHICGLAKEINKAKPGDDLSKYEKQLEEYITGFKFSIKGCNIALKLSVDENITAITRNAITIDETLLKISEESKKRIEEIEKYATEGNSENNSPEKIRLMKQCATSIGTISKTTSQSMVASVNKMIDELDKAVDDAIANGDNLGIEQETDDINDDED
jgi:hypothetical protein